MTTAILSTLVFVLFLRWRSSAAEARRWAGQAERLRVDASQLWDERARLRAELEAARAGDAGWAEYTTKLMKYADAAAEAAEATDALNKQLLHRLQEEMARADASGAAFEKVVEFASRLYGNSIRVNVQRPARPPASGVRLLDAASVDAPVVLPHTETVMPDGTPARLLDASRHTVLYGVRFRQPQLRALLRKVGELGRVPGRLVREPENENDPNAIAVHVDAVCVGYLRREIAELLAPSLDAMTRDRAATIACLVSLRENDGKVYGDVWGPWPEAYFNAA
jgi:hypothetical protein